MISKNQIRKYYDDLVKRLDIFKKAFFEEGNSVVKYWLKKNKIKNFSIFEAYFQTIGREDKDFRQYRKRLEFTEKINQHQCKVELAFYEYIHEYEAIKYFLQDNRHNLENYCLDTIRSILVQINNINKELLKEIVITFNSEYNEFVSQYKYICDKSDKIQTLISVCLHIIYTNHNAIRKVNYSELRKITINDIKIGDIILYDEFERYKSSIARRQIKFWVKSTIMHSAALYDNKQKDPIIYEAAGGNRKKSYLAKFDLVEGTKLIILRPRRSFSKAEIQKFQNVILGTDNQKFSGSKLYGMALNYVLLNLYKNWFPFLTEGKNIFSGEGVFCSELIAMIYNKMGRNLSGKEDFAMVSPIDILNSFELDIVGYIYN